MSLYTTDDGAMYNTAYLYDDRSHLYDEFDLDPTQDGGSICPATGERDVPGDFADRRRAILSFYGHRCGRCLAPLAVSSVGTDAELGYVYSLTEDAWALESLVAVCEPCYEVVSVSDPDRITDFGRAYARAPQFPCWLGDPRIAVERLPLTGREHWLREQLAATLEKSVSSSRAQSRSINEPVASTACLACSTPACLAIAFGELASADATRPVPSEHRLLGQWDTLGADERVSYEQRGENVRVLLEHSFVPAR